MLVTMGIHRFWSWVCSLTPYLHYIKQNFLSHKLALSIVLYNPEREIKKILPPLTENRKISQIILEYSYLLFFKIRTSTIAIPENPALHPPDELLINPPFSLEPSEPPELP